MSIPPAVRAWINVAVTTAVSGAASAVMNLYQSGFDLSKVDYHKMAQVALAGGVIALVNHLRQPPNVTGAK